jgi:hypothetical protein
MSSGPPVAAILIPTHDHAATLDLAVRSALDQTVREIEVIVVGDGVGDDTRELVDRLTRADPRARFMDLPKGPHHGEVHRGTAIDSTAAEIVCYLCDDDLLLPDHVESMAELLRDADLAHSQNGHLEPDGTWHHYFADLESPQCRAWIMEPGQNVVSLTGTAHTASAYRRLPHGWRTTPPGRWPDHHMWQQFLAEPWVRAVTADRVTALQFPSHLGGRGDWPPQRRRAELEDWLEAIANGVGRARLDAAVGRAVRKQATAQWLHANHLEETLRAAEAAHAVEVEGLGDRIARCEKQLAAIESTRTWRLRSRLRRLPPFA